jgi:hypothetical protein
MAALKGNEEFAAVGIFAVFYFFIYIYYRIDVM